LEAHGDLDDKDLDDVQLSEKIFFEYLKKSYFSFLDTGDQANPDMDQELIRMFNDKNAMVIKGIEKYKKDIESLEREWEGLTGTDVLFMLILIPCHTLTLDVVSSCPN
jgi:SMC interacting uncharacterized protein involved in chromosome segregation